MEKKTSEYDPKTMAKFGWKLVGQHETEHRHRGHHYKRTHYEYERPETFRNSNELKELEQEWEALCHKVYFFDFIKDKKMKKLWDKINALQ